MGPMIASRASTERCGQDLDVPSSTRPSFFARGCTLPARPTSVIEATGWPAWLCTVVAMANREPGCGAFVAMRVPALIFQPGRAPARSFVVISK